MNLGVGKILLMIAACLLALTIGFLLPLLPIKLTLSGVGLILASIGVVIVFLLPDAKVTPYKFIFACFFLAVFTRFLWPNFAYVPIPALPTKNPQRVVWALVLAYWLYSLATNKELRERLAQRIANAKIVWLVIGLFTWRFLSIFFADHPLAATQPVLFEIFDYLPALMFVLTWVRDERDVMRLGRWLTLASLLICVFTIIEVAQQKNIFLPLIPFDPSNEEFLQASLESKLRGGAYRAQASFNHPLLLAQFMAVVLPVLVLSARFDAAKWGRRLAVLVLCLLPFVLWASRTRTSVGVAILVVGVLLLAATLNKIRHPARNVAARGNGGIAAGVFLVVLTAAAAAATVFVVQLAVGRTAEETVSSNARVEMFERATVSARNNPIVGKGPGLGGVEAAHVNSRGRSSLDSYLLILLLDSGIPALLAFLALLVAAGARVFRLLGNRGLLDNTVGAWALSVIAFGCTAAVLGTAHNLPLLYMALGVIVALEDRGVGERTRWSALTRPDVASAR